MFKSLKLKEDVYLALEETRIAFLKGLKINLTRSDIVNYAIKALKIKIKEGNKDANV